MSIIKHVWVLGPNNEFLHDEFFVDSECMDFKFTSDKLKSGFHKPVYVTEDNSSVGRISGGEWVETSPVQQRTEIEITKTNTRAHFKNIREQKLKEGVPYSFNGVNDMIQTRTEQDLINISALVLQATLTKMSGNETTFNFRAKSNTTYNLSADEVIALGSFVGPYIQSIYQQSWDIVDAIDSATTIEEIEAIEWQ